MTVDPNYLPIHAKGYSPVQIEIPTWFDLPANTRHEIFQHHPPTGTILDVDHVGGDAAAGVDLELEGRRSTSSGSERDRSTDQTVALAAYDDPAEGGPIATDRLTWSAYNGSATDHTQAAGGPYDTYLGVTASALTVLDKLRWGVPINEREDQLRADLGLNRYLRMGLFPSADSFYQPTLDGKTVLSDGQEVLRADVADGWRSEPADVFSWTSDPREVLYITGVSVDAPNATYGDDLSLSFTRNDTEEFYRMELTTLPGDGYTAPLHIPVLEDLDVTLIARNAVADVDVRLSYSTVARTLLEKALFGRENEVRSDDEYAAERMGVYYDLRDYMAAGVPISPNIDTLLSDVPASAPAMMGGY